MMSRSSLPYHPSLPITSLITVIAGAIVPTPAQAALAQLTQWQFNPGTNQLEITLAPSVTPRYFLMAQPARIVVDLPNTKLGKIETRQSYNGAVRQIRVSQFQKDTTRMVIELAPDVVLTGEQVKLQKVGNRWILRPLIASAAPPTPRSVGTAPQTTTAVQAPPQPIRIPVSVPLPPSPVPSVSVPNSGLPPVSNQRSQQTPTVSVPLPTPRRTSQPLAIPSAGAPRAIPVDSTNPANVPLPPPPTVVNFPRPSTPLLLPGTSSSTSGSISSPGNTVTGSTLNRAPTVTVPAIGQPPRPVAPPVTRLPVAPAPTPNSISAAQPISQAQGNPTPSAGRLIPVIQFGQPLPRAFAPQRTPALPPPEPGAIVLPIEGPK
ncbi:MAG: AMIN domain-containing protein [Leptolyngbyaceae cyanobacterium bins.59]|nr:AMIN domain-containing protein [Leptolyngbyaceae cyanobacterium bins.59]